VIGKDPARNLGRILVEFGADPGSVWDGSCEEFGKDPARVWDGSPWDGSCQSFGTDPANIEPARDTPQYRIQLQILRDFSADLGCTMYMFIIWDKSCGYNTLFFSFKIIIMASIFFRCFG
jgi:hypothetical protein